MTVAFELRVPRYPPCTVSIDGPTQVGRDADLTIDDLAVSRVHALLHFNDAQLTITDLDSSNGTWLNGRRVGAAVELLPGDEVRVGDSTLTLPGATPGRHQPRGQVVDGITVRWFEGSEAQRHGPGVVAAVATARSALAGLPGEPGSEPVIHLVDRLRDPQQPDSVRSEGTVVMADDAQVWVAANTTTSPEHPLRALALLWAGAPPGSLHSHLVEGWALCHAGIDDTTEALQGAPLPAWDTVDDRQRHAMAVSFAHWLRGRSGAAALDTAVRGPAGELTSRIEQLFGHSLARLEHEWRDTVNMPVADMPRRRFLAESRRWLVPYRRQQRVVFALMMLELAFVVAAPLLSQSLFDSAVARSDAALAGVLIGAIGVGLAASSVAGWFRARGSVAVAQGVVRDLRLALFSALQRIAFTAPQRPTDVTVMKRLTGEAEEAGVALAGAARDACFEIIRLALALGVMAWIDLRLALLVVLYLPLISWAHKAMERKVELASRDISDEQARLLDVAVEQHRAAGTIQLFGLGARQRAAFGSIAQRYFGAEQGYGRAVAQSALVVGIAQAFIRTVILGVGVWFVVRGSLTLGGLIAFLGVLGDATAPVTQLSNIAVGVRNASVAVGLVSQFIALGDDSDEPAAPHPLALLETLATHEVTVRHGGLSTALDAVTLRVQRGDRVAVVGQSGSGKSTLLRVLAGVQRPDSGSVAWNGSDLAGTSATDRSRLMSIVSADTLLLNASIADNILAGAPSAGRDAMEAAARLAGVDEFARSMPGGFDFVVGPGGSRLSVGQRQRVCIARAALADPELLLLDEATTGLDHHSRRLVLRALAQLSERCTVITVTHRPDEAMACHRVLVLDHGCIVEQGTPAELVALPHGRFTAMVAQAADVDTDAAEPFDWLSRIDVFAGLPVNDLDVLRDRGERAELKPGDVVPDGERLLVITSGSGTVVAPDVVGRVQQVATMGPGSVFGLGGLLGRPSAATFQATTPVHVVQLRRDEFHQVASQHPGLAALFHTATGPLGSARLV